MKKNYHIYIFKPNSFSSIFDSADLPFTEYMIQKLNFDFEFLVLFNNYF